MARLQNLSVYDASYLALAMYRGLSPAKLDGQRRDAATRVGVPLATCFDRIRSPARWPGMTAVTPWCLSLYRALQEWPRMGRARHESSRISGW